MGLFRRFHQAHAVSRPHRAASKAAKPKSHLRICRIEHIEQRQLLSATIQPIQVGATYFEDSNDVDQSSALQGTTTQVADLLQIGYTGGADGTQLATLTIELDNAFFDTSSGSPGAYGSFPLTILSHAGFEITSSTVTDGGATLTFTFSGFDAGEKLVFTIDVDEQGNLQPNAVAEGAEFEGATLTASFTAPHMEDITTPAITFYDDFTFADAGLATLLPNNNYGNAAATAYLPENCSAGLVYTAGAADSVQQEALPCTLSGTVYEDLDADNTQDSGESGIAGVTLTLYSQDDEGNYVSTGLTTTTDANGDYSFTNLAPGTYKVVESQPNGYLSVGAAAGMVDGETRGVASTVNIIADAALEGGDDSIENNFGEIKPASISGHVYVDADNDGVKDSGETPLANVVITLLDANGNSTGKTTITDSTGYYHFDGLMPGTYGVAEAQPAGYFDGLDTAGSDGGTAYNPDNDLIDSVTLGSGVAATDYNFGELPSASLCGKVFVDLDNDGVVDSGESLLAGVTVYLLDENGDVIAETTTGSDGRYCFTDLAAGSYSVEEIQPDGYLDNNDWIGSVGGETDGEDRIINISLGWGIHATEYNFTETLPASISGYVFQDGSTIVLEEGETLDVPSVRDGKHTSDDKPLAGVTLILCDGSGVPLTDGEGNDITTTTDANGYYEFTGLEPGIYSIRQIQPSGYVAGVDTAGSNGGTVVNTYTYSGLEASLLSSLALSSTDTAIARIKVEAGDVATQYNFSEVLVRTEDPPPDPPPTPPPSPPPSPPSILESPTHWPGGDFHLASYGYSAAPEILMQPLFGGSGGPGGYTWHLSVIDGGSPRNEAAGEFAVNSQATTFDPTTWTGDDLNQSEWTLADQNGAPIKKIQFGLRNARPVTGDWNGDGTTKVAVFIDGLWFFDLNGDGQWDANDLWAKLGHKDDQPVTGDWDGDGKTDIGIFGPSWIGDTRPVAVDPGLPDAQNMLSGRQKNVPPDPADAAVGYRTMKHGKDGRMRSDLIDHVFQFGTKGDVAVTGDWNGDGVRNIAIFRNGTWFLDMDGNGRWSAGDVVFEFGREGDLPVVGDWTGDGVTKVGVYRNGTFHLDTNNDHALDARDRVFQLGSAGDKPVVGDWNGEGVDKLGVYHDGAAAAEAAPQTAVE